MLVNEFIIAFLCVRSNLFCFLKIPLSEEIKMVYTLETSINYKSKNVTLAKFFKTIAGTQAYKVILAILFNGFLGFNCKYSTINIDFNFLPSYLSLYF